MRTALVAFGVISLVSATAWGQATPANSASPPPNPPNMPTPAPDPKDEPTPPQPAATTAPAPQASTPPALPPVDLPKPTEPAATPSTTLPLPTVPSVSMWGSVADVPQKKVAVWYGWKSLLVLGPLDLIGLIGFASEGDRAEFASAMWYPVHLWVGPILHWSRGHIGRGFAVFGTNAVLPLTGLLFAIGAHSVTSGGGYERYERYLKIGAAIGMLGAQTLDLAVFSWDEKTVAVSPPRGMAAQLPSTFSIVPQMDATQKGFAIMGQF